MNTSKRIMHFLDFILFRKQIREELMAKEIMLKNMQSEINILRDNLANALAMNIELSRENALLKPKKKATRAKKS